MYCESTQLIATKICFHYLLLYKKVSQKLVTKINKHLLSHAVFEAQEWLTLMILAYGVSQGYSQHVGQGCSHLKARLELEAPI